MSEPPSERIGTDIVTPEWLDKHAIRVPLKPGDYRSETAWCRVDRHGIITHAEEMDRSIKAELLRRDLLEEHHVYYANVFLDMRRYFKRIVDYSGNGLYALEFFSTDNSGILSTLYLRVCRHMGRDAERMVSHACDMRYHERNRQFVDPYVDKYREAFEALVKAIDSARAWSRKQD